MKLSNENRKIVLDKLLANAEVREIYDKYIVDTISFEEWVESSMDFLLAKPQLLDADTILKKLMSEKED